MSQKQVQAVHDKLAEIDSHVDKGLSICNDLHEGGDIKAVEQALPTFGSFAGVHKLANTLRDVTDEDAAGVKLASCGDDIVMKSEDEIGRGPETVVFAPADLVTTAFEQFGPYAKKEALKRCLDCLNEPSSGEQGAVDAVVAIFKLLEPEERKELFKRLIDM